MCDTKGTIRLDRTDLNPYKRKHAVATDKLTLKEALVGADRNRQIPPRNCIPYNKKEQPRRRFAQRIADGDRLMAAAATAAKAQPADDGNVLPCPNQMAAIRAVAWRRQQRLPPRNAPNHDVQETSNDASKTECDRMYLP